jgi:hypothetical protein
MNIVSKKPVTEEQTEKIVSRLKELHGKGLTKRQAKIKVSREFEVKFK